MAKKKFEVGFNISAALSPAYSTTIGKASSQMSRLGATIKSAESGQKGIKRFQSLKTGIGDVKIALVDARIKAAALKKEFNRTAKPTKKLSAQVAAAHKNVHKLETRLKTQRRALLETKTGLDRAGISTRNLTGENNRLAASLEKSRAAQKRLTRAQATKAGAKSKMRSMAGRATGAAVVTGAAFGIPIFSSAMLNAEMSRVKALSGATKAEMVKMRGQASFLGDTKAGFTARQIGQGQGFLSMSGFKPGETMAAMPGLLDVSKAAGEELGLTADIASNILSGFEIPAMEMGRVGDVLTEIFTSSNTTLPDLGETMKFAAPMANLLKVTLEETGTLAGLIAKIGIRGSQAGTGIQATMSRLAAPKKAGKNALATLGVDTWDEEGNAKNIIDVLGELSEAMEGMGTGEQASLLKDIFGQEHFKTGSKLMKLGKKEILKYYDQINNAHKNGKAALTAKIMDDNEIGRLKGLMSAGDGLARMFGDKLTPAINGGLEAATGMVRGLTSWLKEHDKVATSLAWGIPIVGGLTVAALSLGAAVAGVSFAMAGLTTLGPVWAGIGAAMTGVGWVLAGLKMGFLALNTVILANPIGLAVAALVGGAILVYKYWKPIKGFFSDLWDKISGIVSKFSIISKVGGFFKGKFGGDQVSPKLDKTIPIGARIAPVKNIVASHKATKQPEQKKIIIPDLLATNPGMTGKSLNTNKKNNSFNGKFDHGENSLSKKAKNLSKTSNRPQIIQTVKPIIHITSPDAKGVRQAVIKGMAETTKTMREALEIIMAEERRLAYE